MLRLKQGRFTMEYSDGAHRIIFEDNKVRREGEWAAYISPAMLDIYDSRYFHCTEYYMGTFPTDVVFTIQGEVA